MWTASKESQAKRNNSRTMLLGKKNTFFSLGRCVESLVSGEIAQKEIPNNGVNEKKLRLLEDDYLSVLNVAIVQTYFLGMLIIVLKSIVSEY